MAFWFYIFIEMQLVMDYKYFPTAGIFVPALNDPELIIWESLHKIIHDNIQIQFYMFIGMSV